MNSILSILLIICIIESLASLIFNLNGYRKTGYSVLLIYTIVAISFIIMLSSELLSYYYELTIMFFDLSIDVLDFFLVSSLILAIMLWTIAIIFLKGEHYSVEALLMSLVAGFTIAGELYEKMRAITYINAAVEFFGLLIFSAIITKHFVRVLRTQIRHTYKKAIKIYVLGFIIMVIGGLLTVISDFFHNTPFYRILDQAWIVEFPTGFALISIITALYPCVIVSTHSKIYRFLIVSPGGVTLYSYDFGSGMKTINAQLVGGAMAGISALTKEIIGKDLNLRTFDYQEFYILVEFGSYVAAFMFVERPTKIWRDMLSRALRKFEEKYGKEIADSIIISEFKDFDNELKEIFSFAL